MAGGAAGSLAGFCSALIREAVALALQSAQAQSSADALHGHARPSVATWRRHVVGVEPVQGSICPAQIWNCPHGFLALPGFADNLEGLEDRQLVEVLLAELRVVVLRQS